MSTRMFSEDQLERLRSYPGIGRGRPTGSPTLLFNLATEYLMAAKTIRPGVTTPAKMVATARTNATALTWEKVAHLLTDERRGDLDRLLMYDAGLKMPGWPD